MTNHKANSSTHHYYCPPEEHTVVRIKNVSPDAQKNLVSQVFDLIRENYPEWYPLEREDNWLQALTTGNQNGTKMAVSAVLNKTGNVVGASAMELYRNGTAIINYSIGHKKDMKYLNVIYAATKDMLSGVRELQQRGEIINFIGKEHHLDSDRAHAGYFAVGQVPIDGPTSLVNGKVKYFEVAYGDPGNVDDPDKIQQALGLADPKTGTPKIEDDAVHLWLIQDFAPSKPDIPLVTLLKAFAESYVKEHSIYREKDFKLDPAYQALSQLAKKIPANATYQQAVKASATGAAQFLDLRPDD